MKEKDEGQKMNSSVQVQKLHIKKAGVQTLHVIRFIKMKKLSDIAMRCQKELIIEKSYLRFSIKIKTQALN